MAETVLVTGGTGFVAGWCIVKLLERGYRVRATLRSLDKQPAARAAIETETAPGERLNFVAADLLSDKGWDEAMHGVSFVLHVASPLSGGTPGDRMSLVAPARDGTLRVLRAAVKAGVKRVVMTSAAATTRQRLGTDVVADETMWADENDPQFDAYRVSKIMAEKAAWDFMRAEGRKTEFATILPGAIFGPVLTREGLGSVKIIADLLNGSPRMVPKLGLWIVDVRDLADLHVAAMESKFAPGQRFYGVGEFMWMDDMARMMRERLGSIGAKVPTRSLPGWLVKLVAPFNANIGGLTPMIGRKFELDAGKASRDLGFTPRPAQETLLDCSRSLQAKRVSG